MPTLVQEFTDVFRPEHRFDDILTTRRRARAAGLNPLTWAATARGRNV
ncbi:hypothetical protein [Actinomadura chokoriensis]|uniref:Uncharacterized protein n=1 Tax=Actinomadura chokoriensis TaxID=454156 RepID=A0ABV4QWD5_9ACTN